MKDAPTVVATIVTHNRRADLVECLHALTRQTRPADAVIVIDNASTDGTPQVLAERRGICVIRLESNIGGAGGFRRAIDEGLAADADYLWVMDDDCLPSADALERLTDAAAAHRATERLAGFVPTVIFSQAHRPCGFVFSPALAAGELDGGPFLGLLLTADACRAIGPVRDDFFIREDDTEYCIRLRIAGWRFRAVPDATVSHPSERPLVKTLFGRRITVAASDPWKQYYESRNSLIVAMQMRGSPLGSPVGTPLSMCRWVVGELKEIVLILLVDRRWGWRRVIMRSWGRIDALRGLTGATVAPGQTLPTLGRGKIRSAVRRSHAPEK
jgi:GT2 family glycosyltransferase